ncbi:pyridoxamine 5'-phosphate oxidase family protein [Denitrobaculum tricleocarpae]|uniref:Pyridoxamine 5'-phosphate oxidase family protein n=1 Tax=Denitrobaculum tricleocarpae TaxID=2591009 RepID=A0A545TXJ2_9PROT|nr:pyridoxamine 5'-phosphate oxidase family protein [Denitrobaculum tricleocarpae]TQV81946.1 pyridoxamine 5'-phosphate oxidase family protein [Denitrobaculum tricleocarpae]
MSEEIIRSVAELQSQYGPPGDLAVDKEMTSLDAHCRRFIELSPFVVIATAAADGAADASPRGDAPGFVQILDDKHLLIPDRAGNNRLDSLKNLVENPNIGLLFFVPGMNETLRLNGTALLTTDPKLLEPMSVNRKPPRSALLITVDQVFLQCAKALIRSKLWAPGSQIKRKSFPSLGKILSDQVDGVSQNEADQLIEESQRIRMY